MLAGCLALIDNHIATEACTMKNPNQGPRGIRLRGSTPSPGMRIKGPSYVDPIGPSPGWAQERGLAPGDSRPTCVDGTRAHHYLCTRDEGMALGLERQTCRRCGHSYVVEVTAW